MKQVYVVAEHCVVCDDDDGDGLENDPIPVVAVPLGFFTEEAEADAKALELNKQFYGTDKDVDDIPEDQRQWVVQTLNLGTPVKKV